jgi:hypothetical protein
LAGDFVAPDPMLVQQFLANGFSIGVIRRMGPPGTLKCIIRFLKDDIDLADAANQIDYLGYLNDLTKRFSEAMPKGAKHWGMARKCLNLFFRDALYNFYLQEAYGLAKLESALEIPLDRHVGVALWNTDRALPRWQSVIGLTETDSAKFQAAALRIAGENDTFRVHLDLGYWRAPKRDHP